jgi:hypothetical protein
MINIVNTRSDWRRLVILGLVGVVVLSGVAFGVNYLWQKRFGPTTASAADCELAQRLIDRAQTPPTDPAAAEEWEKEIREIRYAEFANDGISTEVGRYVYWQRVAATGEGDRPTPERFATMRDNALGHCADSGVELRIPGIRS